MNFLFILVQLVWFFTVRVGKLFSISLCLYFPKLVTFQIHFGSTSFSVVLKQSFVSFTFSISKINHVNKLNKVMSLMIILKRDFLALEKPIVIPNILKCYLYWRIFFLIHMEVKSDA